MPKKTDTKYIFCILCYDQHEFLITIKTEQNSGDVLQRNDHNRLVGCAIGFKPARQRLLVVLGCREAQCAYGSSQCVGFRIEADVMK